MKKADLVKGRPSPVSALSLTFVSPHHLRLPQELEGGLRGGVRLSEHRRRGLCQDLASRQVGGLLGEVGVADRALCGAGVFERHAERVDRRSDRELLERAQTPTELADLLDRLI